MELIYQVKEDIKTPLKGCYSVIDTRTGEAVFIFIYDNTINDSHFSKNNVKHHTDIMASNMNNSAMKFLYQRFIAKKEIGHQFIEFLKAEGVDPELYLF